jgi:multiple sugar transport system permease protein
MTSPPALRAALLSLLLLPALLSAAPEPAARAPIEIKVFGLPNPADTSVGSRADQAVLAAFRARYPHILPRTYTGVSVAGEGMDSTILMAIAGRVGPDILYVNMRYSDTFVRQGFLAPLDEYVARIPPDALARRIPPPAWPVIRRPGPDGKEHIWAVPYSLALRGLAWRKDLFQDAGLDPESPPANWDELKEFARRLTNPEKGTYGIGLNLDERKGAWDWINFLWSAGGEAMVQGPDGQWRAAFSGPAAAESMLYYTSLVTEEWTDAKGRKQKGYVCHATPYVMNRLWQDGKVGMFLESFSANSIVSDIDPEVIGLAPMPLGPTGVRGGELNCAMMGLFADIQPRDGHSAADIRQAAWDYLWFFDSEEARRIRTRVFVEAGYGRMVNPVLLKQFGYEEYLRLQPPGLLQAVETALATGKPEPYGANCQAIYNYMTYPLNECLDLAERGQLGATREEKLARIERILAAAVERTNVEMVGHLPPGERQRRNRIAVVVAMAVLAAFLLALWRVWRIFNVQDSAGRGAWQFRRYAWAYLILLPAVLSILIWMYLPMVMGSGMVGVDYRVVGESQFVGVRNFADVLWDPVWWASLGRTLYYMTLIFLLGFWTPIALAILLAEVSRFKVLYRTIYYLPAVMSGFVVIYLWKLLFDPSDLGTLNRILAAVGLPAQKWLNDSALAMICCIIPTVWAGMGPGCLIYLAALKSVPDDLYEAADIDGCGFWGKVRHITLPTLKPLIIIQFVATFIGAAQSGGWILVMTFGGPNEATKVADLHIFEKSYFYLQFGAAVTMAWILGVLLLTFTVYQLKILSRMEFRSAGAAEKSKA